MQIIRVRRIVRSSCSVVQPRLVLFARHVDHQGGPTTSPLQCCLGCLWAAHLAPQRVILVHAYVAFSHPLVQCNLFAIGR
jgi:hypothetical protein